VSTVRVAQPSDFATAEIDDFVALVLAGNEVSANGLKKRVIAASQLAFLCESDCLLGVAGLKKPTEQYRSYVQRSSKTALRSDKLPYELGWVFIRPDARGRGLSLPLCEAIVTAAEGCGIFATSRTNNAAMHRTLTNIGFDRVGSEWRSRQNDGDL